MYNKPNTPEQLIVDYETVLKETVNKSDMLSYYAFHGVKSEISMSIAFLKRRIVHSEKGSKQSDYLRKLETLNDQYYWSY